MTTTPVPATMRALQQDRGGGPEVLAVRTIAVPSLRAGEVLVRVFAASVNAKDLLLRARRGRRNDPRGAGFDVAGEVVACAEGVEAPAVGTRVMGFLDGLAGGTMAEYVPVRAEWLTETAPALAPEQAAALPLAASTALQALRDVARLQRGERVLIKGATGGVGSVAIQVARLLGATVTAVAAGAGVAHVRALGADEVLAPGSLAADRAGRWDVFLDCAGATPVRSHRHLLVPAGRWVTVAPNLPVFILAPLSRLTARLLGTRRFAFVVVRPRREDLRWIAAQATAGALRMPIASTHPLESVADAHRALERRGTLGKRVVVISHPAQDAPRARTDHAGTHRTGTGDARPSRRSGRLDRSHRP